VSIENGQRQDDPAAAGKRRTGGATSERVQYAFAMAIPFGYSLRPPTPYDLEAVGEVLVADDPDEDTRTLDAGFVRSEWSRPGFDAATDAWVVVDGHGVVVGYAQVMLEDQDIADSWGVVHPEHRGRGLGSALLDRVEARAGALLAGLASSRLRHAIEARDGAAAALLRARGLRPVRHFWHMQIDLVEPLEQGLAPEGTVIGAIAPREDLAAVHAVLHEAFAGDWEYHPGPFDRWSEDHASDPGYDPTLWLLAREGHTPVGAVTAIVSDGRGWVNELGVVPAQRRRGIAAALVRCLFVTFARRGVRRVILNVDAQNPTGATTLYERVGMRVVKRWVLWERSPV